MSTKCPNCGFSYRKTRSGDWIRLKTEYDSFWIDKPVNVKLAIEDYFMLNSKDPKMYILQFTTNHNEAEWAEVKRVFQELRVSGCVHDSYLS